jgi:predicted glycosyltransferase
MNIGGYKMTTALFTNQVLTQATPATVRALLADPLNLPAWATAITTVKPTATGYVLQRSGSVFDQPEQLQVTVGTDQVIYHSEGGQLGYEIVFTMTPLAERTAVQEEVSLTTTPPSWLPLPLVKPVMQRDFQRKLGQLATLAEEQPNDD